MADAQDLSERELEILRLLATGASNKEIAHRLAISPNTVKVHLRNIFDKMEVTSRTEAMLAALQRGIISPPGLSAPLNSQPVAAGRIDDGAALAPEENPSHRAAMPDTRQTPPVASLPRRIQWVLPAGLALVLLGWLLARLLLAAAGERQFAVQESPSATAPATTIRRWQVQAGLPVGRAGMGAAVYENTIYMISGQTAQGITPEVLRYEASSDRWQAVAPKPTAVRDAQAVVLGEKIYVPGGQLANGQPSDRLEVYDPRADRWELQSLMPRPLCRYGLAAYEGRLYLFGGWDGQRETSNVWIYDPASRAWTAGTALPEARSSASAVAIEGKILVIGGQTGERILAETLAYYPSRDLVGENPWEQRASLPAARAAAAAAQIAGQVYLVGGRAPGSPQELLPLLQYLPGQDQWLTLDLPPQPVGTGGVLLRLETRLHMLGGQVSQQFSPQHQTYQAIYTLPIPLSD